ncbi:hypothetical protein [Streptomyces netropsis]|uniref:Uncharacterized protein n=1 Tax=Streptomyces netropsis TaxID=55404 RepID=A0A7W7L7B5_STRNE|nr:hypothetical protein [Streptomyces netropsis]MBB4884386.1 hypothetical protein [Streptomyces netropsis]GGR04058.1 hypothetical protein GCM10010219_05270 [Streptomyces netropsis]
MPSEEFDGRNVDVIDFDDASSGEHVIEFRAPWASRHDSILAVSIPEGGQWRDATVSIDPNAGDLPAAFIIWAIKIAQMRLE